MPLPRFAALNRRKTIVALHDMAMTAAAWELALWTAFALNGAVRPFNAELLISTGLVIAVASAVYAWRGLYRGIWHYASVRDLIMIGQAVAVTLALSALAIFLVTRFETVPRSSLVLFWPLTMLLLAGPRLAYRALKDGNLELAFDRSAEARVPVVLIGAGDEAETFVRAMDRRGATHKVMGLLAVQSGRVGRDIRGVPVLGRVADLERVIDDLKDQGRGPHRVILASGKLDGAARRDLFKRTDALGLPLDRLPRATEFRDGAAPTAQPVAVEDLLGRPQRVLDRDGIARLISGRRVLITGAGGTIGGELARQVAALGPAELTLVDNGEHALYQIDLELSETWPDVRRLPALGDIRDADRMHQLIVQTAPEVVFHAAAFKHVPLVEANPAEGILTNVAGTRIVAEACAAGGVPVMVMISTDKAVNPTNVMGASKRVAEMVVQALSLRRDVATRFVTVRFGNVLGSTGSVVPLFQRQLVRGGPLTVTHPDVTRYFMTVREAVELVLQASALAPAEISAEGRIFVLDMGEPVKIIDLARAMIRLAGHEPETQIEIAFTGLRPGEKLYEEVLHEAEPAVDTPVDGLMLAAPRLMDWQALVPPVDQLLDAAHRRDAAAALAALRGLVPEYAPDPAPAGRAADDLPAGKVHG